MIPDYEGYTEYQVISMWKQMGLGPTALNLKTTPSQLRAYLESRGQCVSCNK
ncbi:hypothetical protein AHIS2_p081 [Acaryochloris phage A-HIS2]|nr:hypothetical protein AHIS2_p081 [Acaryochloris phage A-HIS2]